MPILSKLNFYQSPIDNRVKKLKSRWLSVDFRQQLHVTIECGSVFIFQNPDQHPT